MNNFDAMNRQYPIPKMKEGTYPFARNIILTDKYTSVMNEPGAKHIDTIPGLTIGEIVTSSHIVYFSTDLTYSYIGYRKLSGEDTSYKNIIKSKYFNFQIDCPIEGIFYYNYKNELIVGWCDGIFENSNSPYLLNLDDLPFELNNEKELIYKEDLNKARWFPYTKEPKIDINYYDNGDVQADSMHITMTYCLEDGTELFWFPIDTMAYPKVGLEETSYRLVEIILEDLDIFYKYYKIGFVINKNGASTAYKSDVLFISKHDKELHLIDSLVSYFEIPVEDLAFINLSVDKVNTLTFEANQVFMGAFTTKESEEDNLQKYVNKLELQIRGVTVDKYNNNPNISPTLNVKYNHPSLLPNEVYSFKLKAKRLDGTYTDSFHIPNNDVRDNIEATTAELEEYGLGNLANKSYKKFEIFNNSYLLERIDFNNHIYKCGTFLTSEVYPDEIDYNSSDIGGEDLRGKQIRYHRMPSIRTITLAKRDGILSNISNDSVPYMLFPFITNLEDVFPKEILDKYQSFTLEIVKRNKSNCLIQDCGVIVKNALMASEEKGFKTTTQSGMLGQSFKGEDISNHKGIFGNSAYFSNLSINNRISFSKGSVIEIQGIVDTNRHYVEYIKEIDDKIEPYYKSVLDSYYIPDTAFAPAKSRFAVLKNYKYYESNRSTNSTRFAPNQCIFSLDSSNKPLDRQDINYFNPLKNVEPNYNEIWQYIYDNTSFTYEVPFEGLDQITVKSSDFLSTIPNNRPYKSLLAVPSEAYVGIIDIININTTGYKLKESNLITIGKIYKSSMKDFVVGGDVYLNTRLEILETAYEFQEYAGTVTHYNVRRVPIIINRLFSTSNNSIVKSEPDTSYFNKASIEIQEIERYARHTLSEEESLNILNTLDFEIKSYKSIEGDTSRLNDMVASTSLEDSRGKFINKFPFRIIKSLIVQKESLTSRNIRVFKPDSYYDMPNDKGLIVAIRSSSRKLYIQQKYSLFVSEVNATMNTNTDETVYLGQSLFLDRPPIELLQNNNLGYIGCQSKFACKVFRDGLIIIDMLQGKIFIINDSIKEVSNQLMRSYYKDNLKINLQNARYNKIGLDAIDNPFIGIGYNVTFDNEYERIIFTKQEYILRDGIDVSNYDFNGEVYIAKDNSHILEFNETNYINKSETFSIATETLGTVSNHDYFPSSYNFTNNGLFYNKQNKLLLNTKVFSMNSHDIEVGNHDGKIVESYIDIPFNKRLDLSKLYQALYWVTEVVDKNNVYYQEETLSKILLYNYNQCSGMVDLDVNRMSITRNAEGIWQFNEFRDLVKDVNLPIIHNDGKFNESNINNNKYYFNKSNFIGIFIVARLYFKNGTMNTTYLHNVNVKSIISKR